MEISKKNSVEGTVPVPGINASNFSLEMIVRFSVFWMPRTFTVTDRIFVLQLLTEQLFTCKLGGRKPTRSGKSPTHSRHFAQMG